MSKIELQIAYIDNLVLKGQNSQAAKALRTLKKTSKITARLRYHLSRWHLHLGQPIAAFKILGREKSTHELKHCNHWEVQLQSRLAYMHSQFGAIQTAERIFEKIVPLFKNRPDLREYWGKQFFRFYGAHALSICDYAKAQHFYQEALNLFDPNDFSYTRALCELSIADCLEALGQKQAALEQLKKIKKTYRALWPELAAIVLGAWGEYLIRGKQLKLGLKKLEAACIHYSPEDRSKDWANLCLWRAIAYWKLDQKKIALPLLTEAYKIRTYHWQNNAALLTVLYWAQQIEPKLIKKWEYSATLISTYPIIGAHTKLIPEQKSAQVSYFFIGQQSQVRVVDYSQQVRKFWPFTKNHQHVLDLISGLDHQPDKTSYPVILPTLIYQALTVLTSAGTLGINIWAFIDLLYGAKMEQVENLILRLESLINQMRLNGYEVKRTDHKIYFLPPPQTAIFFSPQLKAPDLAKWSQYRLGANKFQRIDIEKILNISSRSANLYLKKWKEENLLTQEKKGTSMFYLWV